MPVKALSRKLVRRLRKVAPYIEKFLGNMKGVDHRPDHRISYINSKLSRFTKTTILPGRRVRELNVRTSFPGERVAIKQDHILGAKKRTHEMTAKGTIKEVRSRVKEHNKRFNPKLYNLREPIAYPISDNLIAMAHSDKPSQDEIFTLLNFQEFEKSKKRKQVWKEDNVSKRAISFWSALKKKHNFNNEQYYNASKELFHNLKLMDSITIGKADNMMLIGFEKGKFIFMPYVDVA